MTTVTAKPCSLIYFARNAQTSIYQSLFTINTISQIVACLGTQGPVCGGGAAMA
jgi:hypothetical protein